MKVVTRLASVLCLLLPLGWASAASAQKTYTWSDIDCGQSRIAPWPGLRCKTTNVVTTESNWGAFRRWATFGTTSEGYIHIFVWEAQNPFSYITTEDSTADFLKWMYENGRSASQFSPVVRYHEADYASFRDGQRTCAGFRRTGKPQRGGYDRIIGGILCSSPGRNLTTAEVTQFIDRVRLQ
jgi:hypothetical protein